MPCDKLYSGGVDGKQNKPEKKSRKVQSLEKKWVRMKKCKDDNAQMTKQNMVLYFWLSWVWSYTFKFCFRRWSQQSSGNHQKHSWHIHINDRKRWGNICINSGSSEKGECQYSPWSQNGAALTWACVHSVGCDAKAGLSEQLTNHHLINYWETPHLPLLAC